MLTACSTQSSYKYLDWIIPWYVGDYVTLNEEQEYLLSSFLETSLSWHKETQIPEYIDTLSNIKTQLNHMDAEKLRQYYKVYQDYWTRIVIKMTPKITKLLQTAGEEQIDELFDNLVQQNNRLREQYLLPSHNNQIHIRSDQFIQQMRYWVGDLSPLQLRAISNWSEKLLPSNHLWIQQRLHWQEHLRLALEFRQDKNPFESVMHELMIYPDRYWSEQYANTQKINEQYTIQLLLYLIKDLSLKQHEFLVNRIEELLEQLSDIQYSSF